MCNRSIVAIASVFVLVLRFGNLAWPWVQVTADGELRRLSVEEQLAANEDEAQWSWVDEEGQEHEEEGGSNQTIVDNNSAQVRWRIHVCIRLSIDVSLYL